MRQTGTAVRWAVRTPKRALSPMRKDEGIAKYMQAQQLGGGKRTFKDQVNETHMPLFAELSTNKNTCSESRIQVFTSMSVRRTISR